MLRQRWVLLQALLLEHLSQLLLVGLKLLLRDPTYRERERVRWRKRERE